MHLLFTVINECWHLTREDSECMFSFFLRCVDMVKSSQYVELANDLEINKAITYLRQKDFNQVRVSAALRVLPSFLVCVFYNHTFHS